MSQATLIMQKKLSELGYSTPITGKVHKSDFTDASRTVVKKFKSEHGLENNGYINADFLKKLDSVYYASNSGSTYPKSHYTGWNLDIEYTTDKQYSGSPDRQDGAIPDNNVIIYDENGMPVNVDTKGLPALWIAVAIAGAFYVWKNGNKKKRNR